MVEEDTTSRSTDEATTIYAIASDNEDFSTLVSALEVADLTGTLNNDGPFTVFAPTNSAFEKLKKGTMDELLKPENEEKLIGLLSYHVVPKAYSTEDVKQAINNNDGTFTAETIDGAVISFTLDADGNIVVNGVEGNNASVTTPDVEASNGVIHAIDRVIMPE